MVAELKTTLFLMFSLAVFSMAGDAGNALAESPSQDVSKSVTIPLPSSIADSLPWFAVRELDNLASPFTRGHLAKFAQDANRVALVYFATWCLPCRAGVKKLSENSASLEENKVKVVLVNIGERDENSIREWLKKIGAEKFKVVGDPFHRLTEGFGLVNEGEEMSLPRTIVLDNSLKPLFMVEKEGTDWPYMLWQK